MLRIHENVSEETMQNRNEYRNRVDLLRNRASLLTGRDRLLMTMYLENGNTFGQMARLAGVNESSIARRINKIVKRLLDGQYITCLRNSEKFDADELGIAKDYFLDGLSLRKIASKRKRTFYRVRKTMQKIQGIVRVPQKA
jgi:predicted DNA-binding protein YlxM (UPF0122 family)